MNLSDCSDYDQVLKQAKQYYGNDTILLPSTRATKKYMIFDPYTNKFIHFGGMGYLDYKKREAGVGKLIYPSGNMEKDMREIMDFYKNISPKFTDKFSIDVDYGTMPTAKTS